jgi:predicted RNA-binding Zn ribbon-like protein
VAIDFAWDGGRPCLDLINTMRDRKTGPRELLREPGDLAEWLRGAGLVDGPARVSEDHLELAIGLREAADRLVLGQVRKSDVDMVNAVAAARPAPRRLAIARGALVVRDAMPDDPVAVGMGRVASDVIELLAGRSRVKICASAGCGLRFEDRSPAGNRQWCSMSRCGNREKARQHYRRQRR